MTVDDTNFRSPSTDGSSNFLTVKDVVTIRRTLSGIQHYERINLDQVFELSMNFLILFHFMM